ncbi:autotransporter domain-containing protein [Luteimonas dalianensis]|uniref:autotransporter domain-containing protein n=1 Tax=Luteimonas dalianensis TaxID=1148196 RepID=UPI003BF016EA
MTPRSPRLVPAILAGAIALATGPALADEGRFSRTVFFGDSLTDGGFFRPLLPPEVQAVTGQFTTNPGWVWAQHLAERYGTDASANGNGQAGDNYAVGGARVAGDVFGALGPTPSVASQVQAFMGAGGVDPDALYSVWGGANDVFAVAAGAPPEQTIGTAVAAQVGLVGALQGAGARYVLVPNLPDMGITPAARAQGPLAQGQLTALAAAYNDALFGGLAASGLRVIPLDTFSFLREVAASPGEYGFANVTGTACEPQITAQSLTCSPASYTHPDAPKTYLFADGVHPTDAGHAALADFAASVLEAPALVAAMPQAAAATGRGRAERVAWHVESRPDTGGWWADVAGNYLRRGDGDLHDGFGPALTVGLDWVRGNAVFGAFGGYGQTRQHWGLSRGDFRYEDVTIGGYAGWFGDSGGWGVTQLGWSQLDFESHRRVRLGQGERSHRGSTDGESLVLATHLGWDFERGNLRHGPVVSLVWQQIEMDGFAESDAALSTSLAYPDQDIDSMIGSVGWQVAVTGEGAVRPYARFTWDNEFEDMPDEALAIAQTMSASGAYAVPTYGADDSYGSITLGARTALFGLDANVGISGTVGHDGGGNTAVFLSLGRGF